MTSFDQWLAALAAAGKRAADIHIDRGIALSYTFAIEGDWTGATVESDLRVHPDTGSILESLTASAASYNAGTGLTSFTLSLAAADTATLPTDPTGEGVTRLAWDVLFTPSGGPKMRLMGAVANVIGEVTDA